MIFSFQKLAITLGLSLLSLDLNAINLCSSTFFSTPRSNDLDPTSAFISYLGILFEENILTIENLVTFKNNLENDLWIIPIGSSLLISSSTHSIHSDTLKEFMLDHELDRHQIISWLKKRIGEIKNQEQILTQSITDTKSRLFQPMIFNPIELYENKYVMVMATPVTQYHWSKTMGENPSHFKDGDSSETIVIDGETIKLQPNHPVENITLYSAMVYANILSENEGLTPYYEFIYHRAKDFEFVHRSLASKGVLDPNSSVEFIEHAGDGYRLPTSLERERLYQILAARFVENYRHMLLFRAWLKENSDNKTHEIAQLKPFRNESNLFYDFIGNVEEWAVPFYKRGNEKRVRISREESYYKTLKSFMHNKYNESGVSVRPDRQYPFVGFRLLRNITPPKEKEVHK